MSPMSGETAQVHRAEAPVAGVAYGSLVLTSARSTDRRHLELAQRKPCITEERVVTEDTVVQVFVLVSQFSNCPPLSK